MNKKKISRNEACWCGSSKKYKYCHFDSDQRLISLKAAGYPVPPRSLIKTPAQLAGIRKSAALTKKLLDGLDELIKPGVSTNELDKWVHTQTLAYGATPAPLQYRGFPKSICTSINEVICHGIPSDRVLIEGDIINVDITCVYNGYYGDSCRMYTVGQATPKANHLIDVTKQCLDTAIATLKPFMPLNCVGDTITSVATQAGYSVVDMFGGHGVGNAFHEEPFVFHCKRKEKQMIIVPGMVFTIEPMINEGKKGCVILDDEWTAVTEDGLFSAQWEHTVHMTDTGLEVLT